MPGCLQHRRDLSDNAAGSPSPGNMFSREPGKRRFLDDTMIQGVAKSDPRGVFIMDVL